MQGAQGSAKGLDGRNDFGILAVAPIVKVTERDDLDKVKERGGLLAAGDAKLAIELSPHGRELFAEPLLLVVAARLEIGAVWRAGDSCQAMLPATLTADEAAEGRAGSFPLALMTMHALAHFAGDPFFSDFRGSTNP